jgi:Flp pilus assembly protein TadG
MATVRTPLNLFGRFGRRCRAVCGHQEGGQVIAFFAVGLVAVVGVAAFVVDVGRFYLANRQLQASSDAVATALANQLPDVRAGTTTLAAVEANAATYGADSSQKNKGTDLTSLSLTFTPKCLTVNGSVPAWCTPSKPNAVQVKQSATVNTVFGKVVGISSAGISATSTAKMGGGKPFPAHVMIVVDRTGSMSTSCSAGGTKLTCAKNGVDAFLSGMDPTYDKVGLAVLPPASNSGACAQPKTSDGAPNDYDVYTNNYVVVGLSNDYKTSSTSPLNPSSTLVSDINCMKAGGTTAYATAIDKAQAVLAANHDPNSQDAIIFFTDGEATYGPCVDANNDSVCDNNASTYRSRPCYQGTQSAGAAKAAGTWVYTVLYDTNTTDQCWAWKASGTGTKLGGGSGSCNVAKGIQFLSGCYESPAMTAYGTVQSMASDSSKFFYSPNPASLTSIFQDIADDLGGSRIVDDDYTGS